MEAKYIKAERLICPDIILSYCEAKLKDPAIFNASRLCLVNNPPIHPKLRFISKKHIAKAKAKALNICEKKEAANKDKAHKAPLAIHAAT